MMWDIAGYLSSQIGSTLLSRRYPVLLKVGRRYVDELVNESCSLRVTVRGQDRPIFEAYRRDHPEAVPMYRVWDQEGAYPAVTGRAFRHMQCLKRAFGISHFDGVPIEMTDDDRIDVISRGWEDTE